MGADDEGVPTRRIHALDANERTIAEALKEAGYFTTIIGKWHAGKWLKEHLPMLAYAPGTIKPGTKVTQMVQNIDIAPTLLDAAGVRMPKAANMDGRSFLPLLHGKSIRWRDHILYEYYWEWNFPATPTVFAIRTERYKYIFYHGLWDHDGFYDLQTDPRERHNLINVPACRERMEAMKK